MFRVSDGGLKNIPYNDAYDFWEIILQKHKEGWTAIDYIFIEEPETQHSNFEV